MALGRLARCLGTRARGMAGADAAAKRGFHSLPVLDYGTLLKEPGKFAKELDEACSQVGFFVLGGLPQQTVDLHARLLETTRAFFALPEAEKSRIDYGLSPQFRGYMRLGVENTAGKVDEREQIEFWNEEPVENPGPDEPLYLRLRGPNQWPERPMEFRETVQQWLADTEAISRRVTSALSAALGLGEEGLDDMFREAFMQAKLVHYPAPPENSEGLGCGAHADSGFLTLLLQDDVGGLEVLNSEGKWVTATPIPGSLVVNLGEVVQLLSGGRYLSTLHRVQRPPTGSGGRLSAPYFWNPSLDTVVRPLVSPRGTAPGADSSERPSSESNCLIPSYGMNAFKSMARSHPQVFARHHPDLQVLKDGRVVRRQASAEE